MHDEEEDFSKNVYPFTRWEECSWQPEEAARNLASLLSECPSSLLAGNTSAHHHGHHVTSNPNHGSSRSLDSYEDHLLSRGWSSKHARMLRTIFGKNDMSNVEESGKRKSRCTNRINRTFPCLFPIITAFTDQLKEPLILMLLVSALISFIMGEMADALSIGLALAIVGMVAAVQEYRSEAALEKLADLVPHTCTVIRDGRVMNRFPARDLVVGDLVMLGTGDRVPADCRLVDTVELSVDESSLTGENTPVEKTGSALPMVTSAGTGLNGRPNLPLIEQQNVAFMGTLVSGGRGRALVIAIGSRTEFGKVAQELNDVETRKSPLQTKIDELGKMLAGLSGIIIALIALLGWCLGRPFLKTVTVAVSLAVAAIPEGLPICVTVTLALGVLRMARLNAIVKKLPAVEALGSATVVASDKTGTLTQNEMTARSIYTLAYPKLSFGLTGVGYNPNHGELVRTVLDTQDDTNSNPNHDITMNTAPTSTQKVLPTSMEFGPIQALFGVACLCNNAVATNDNTLSSDNDDHSVSRPGFNATNPSSEDSFVNSGQPTELALLVGASKCGVSDPRPLYHRLQEIPFSSDRKRMEVKARPIGGDHFCNAFNLATISRQNSSKNAHTLTATNMYTPSYVHNIKDSTHDGSLYFVKGMPEAVLGECSTHIAADGSATNLTEKGRRRALLQSRKMAASGLRVLAMAYGLSLENLTFAGLIGMEDPPREGVVDAVRQLRRSGVTVLMVTGDSKETALSIAKRCGIVGDYSYNHLEYGENEDIPSSMCTIESESSSFGYSSSHYDDIEDGAGLALSGEQLDAIPSTTLVNSTIGVKVFYRVAPRHKLALVRAYQQRGEVVAMTGDGVNDATALKAADIGIAMGKEGTDVAKEAADMVLTDDDFSTIVKAVAEGKGIFFNIRNFLAFQLSTSFAALSMETFATIFGMPSPLNPMQILWINIIMDGPPAQSLGVEPVDERILKARPRKATDPIVTKALLFRAITSAALILFLTLRVFSLELDDGKITRRDTTMTFMTFVNCDLFNAYACRSSERYFYELDLFGNPTFLFAVGGSVIGQLAVIYFPPLQEIFQTEALSMRDFLYILILSSTVLILDTLRKKFCRACFSDNTLSLVASSKKHDRSENVELVSNGIDDYGKGSIIIQKKTERNKTVRTRQPFIA